MANYAQDSIFENKPGLNIGHRRPFRPCSFAPPGFPGFAIVVRFALRKRKLVYSLFSIELLTLELCRQTERGGAERITVFLRHDSKHGLFEIVR